MRRRGIYGHRIMRLLPYIRRARLLGFRRLDDILAIVAPAYAKDYSFCGPLHRSVLERAIGRLHELGLDPGLDDRSTARKLGRPTRGKSVTDENGSIPAGETGQPMSSGQSVSGQRQMRETNATERQNTRRLTGTL
jgi:hypothetical protein